MRVKPEIWRPLTFGGALVLAAVVATFAAFTQHFAGALAVVALAMMLVISTTQR